ncbi:MAG: helix-hairpin-helix domain-containing protein, partial [Bacteroidota bacterium]
ALYPFNPNEINAAQLLGMGLPKRTVRSWMSYLKKGGRFQKMADLERFRALNKIDLNRLASYLIFPSPPTNATQPVAKQEITLSRFDPNEQSRSSLGRMGLPERVARKWENYLKAGGRFRKAEDILKVYGLTQADYDRLLPYIDFPDYKEEWSEEEAVPEVTLPSSYEKTRTAVIDVNKATAREWQGLRGIGPAYSRRIVKFRDKLGGFHNLDQIKETYGLPDSVFKAIYLQLRHSPIFRKLSINTATIEELAAHPYLYFQDARLIINYRKEHGAFNAVEDVQKLYGLEAETIKKMEPYWDFSQ